MNSDPGTYVLILRSRSKATTRVGRLGRVTLDVGYYLYVGSAFGPGGVKARVSRHFRKDKRRHWHIDYLREYLEPISAWYTHDRKYLEHQWARLLSEVSGLSSIQGFGSSDCACISHLFYTQGEPDFVHFSDLIGSGLESCSFHESDAP